MPIEETIDLLATEKVTDDMARVLASGFGALLEVLKALETMPGDTHWRNSQPWVSTRLAVC
jgi:hypothetical protein